jgi:hypothetical protein
MRPEKRSAVPHISSHGFALMKLSNKSRTDRPIGVDIEAGEWKSPHGTGSSIADLPSLERTQFSVDQRDCSSVVSVYARALNRFEMIGLRSVVERSLFRDRRGAVEADRGGH